MAWLILIGIASIMVGILTGIFGDGYYVGEAMGVTFVIIVIFAIVIGLVFGSNYSEKPENYHFIETSYTLVVCESNIFTLTKDNSGQAVYNYIYENDNGEKVSDNISASANIVFEYSDTATPMIYIYDAVYNSKVATTWLINPTIQNIKIIAPKDSIINTLY